MRFKNFIKIIPFLSTFLLIIFLSISNKKDFTKLKILIWNTPTLSLGTYLAISSGSGFIISYIVTSKLAKIIQSKPKQTLNFKDENKNEYNQKYTNTTSDKTLIERDFNDPSPTVNASFRVIGKLERRDENSLNRDYINEYNDSTEFENEYFEEYEKEENIYEENSNSSDWNDDSLSSW